MYKYLLNNNLVGFSQTGEDVFNWLVNFRILEDMNDRFA